MKSAGKVRVSFAPWGTSVTLLCCRVRDGSRQQQIGSPQGHRARWDGFGALVQSGGPPPCPDRSTREVLADGSSRCRVLVFARIGVSRRRGERRRTHQRRLRHGTSRHRAARGWSHRVHDHSAARTSRAPSRAWTSRALPEEPPPACCSARCQVVGRDRREQRVAGSRTTVRIRGVSSFRTTIRCTSWTASGEEPT